MPKSFIDEQYDVDEDYWTISQVCTIPRGGLKTGHAVLVLESYIVDGEYCRHTIEWYDFMQLKIDGYYGRDCEQIGDALLDVKRDAKVRVCPWTRDQASSAYYVNDPRKKRQVLKVLGLQSREILDEEDEDQIRCWQKTEFFKEHWWSLNMIDTWMISAEKNKDFKDSVIGGAIQKAEIGEIKFQVGGGDGEKTFNCLTWVWKQLHEVDEKQLHVTDEKIDKKIAEKAEINYKSRSGFLGSFFRIPINIGEDKARILELLFKAIEAFNLRAVKSALDKGADINYNYSDPNLRRDYFSGGSPLVFALQVASEICKEHSKHLQKQQKMQEVIDEYRFTLELEEAEESGGDEARESRDKIYKLTEQLETINKEIFKKAEIIAIVACLVARGAELICTKIDTKNIITVMEEGFGAYEQIWAAVKRRRDLVDICGWYIASGTEFKRNGDLDKAIRYYKKATKLQPSKILAWSHLGLIYRDCRKYEAAINSYKKALEIDPDNYNLLSGLGLVYQKNHQDSEATKYYDKARDVKARSMGVVISILNDIYHLDETRWVISLVENEIIILEKNEVRGGSRIVERFYYEHGVKRERLAVTNRTALLEKLKEQQLIRLDNPLIARVCSKRVTREKIEDSVKIASGPTAQEWARDFFVTSTCAESANPRIK
jgi:tetratricopeptide (TPR) repeat protein